MARIARVVIPGIPHHVTQRGNRRQKVFFSAADRESYISYLEEYAKPAGIAFWAYCLMDNHVHFIVVPESEDSLARGFGEAHRRYTRMINFRESWRGYLWQGRFFSNPLDEPHLYAACRYVEQNPLRARLVQKAEDYPWSSAAAHVFKKPDRLCSDFFMLQDIQDWARYLSVSPSDQEIKHIRSHSRSGRPLGSDQFIRRLEQLTGACLFKEKPGPRPGH